MEDPRSIEEAYQTYLTECLKVKNGSAPRRVKDFSKFNSSDAKPFFERLMQMKGRSGDMFNVTVFMRALAVHYGGFFPAKALVSQTAMKLYREYIAEFNNMTEPEDIRARLVEDCRFVSRFCVENGLNDVIEYFHHNEMIVPSPVKHAYSGMISYYFLACCDTFPVISKCYPQDAMDMIRSFDYRVVRIKVAQIPSCKVIADNLGYIIRMSMSKMRSLNSK